MQGILNFGVLHDLRELVALNRLASLRLCATCTQNKRVELANKKQKKITTSKREATETDSAAAGRLGLGQ